ncbi:MAG: TatD family hydrolase [Candidatus Krumholzibacteriota bacterium]|nr:TatD family hydrolase [Candidatus Krumholzibacteriota bacterium]
MIDSHAHLHHADFDGDRDAVFERLRDAGVTRILEVGIDRPGLDAALALAARYPEVRAAVGCHPHEARRWDAAFAADLRAAAAEEPVVAIGEIGLDFYRDHSPRDAQERAFREQLAVARETGSPVVFHVRAAEADFLRVLDEEGDPTRAVLHAFSHDAAFARECVGRGFWLGVGGMVTFPGSRLPGVLADLSPDCVLLETDCPWLSPVPHRGKRNEPARLIHVLARLAELWRLPASELEARLDANFERFCGR